jgi:hypothetical protein
MPDVDIAKGVFLDLTHKMDARDKNHCAYCHGKFGLVRHRRAFKSFCSQKCVDHYKAWLRADVGKRKRRVRELMQAQWVLLPALGAARRARLRDLLYARSARGHDG